MANQAAVVTFENIVAAAHRLRGHIRLTPCVRSERLSFIAGTHIWMKKDNMQHTGSYKERGSLNKLRSLSTAECAKGVMAASAGNHAQGLAYHAGRLGVKATIFMAHGTPTIKVTRTQFYGATVKMAGYNFDEAYAECAEAVQTSGTTLIHPFDDPVVIAGQGTMGLEILEQAPNTDVIVCPIGGGGLISGIATAAKAINPRITIIGVEPAAIPTMSLMAKHPKGEIEVHPPVTTIADGINVRKVGSVTSKICRSMVDHYVQVTDEEICRAILFLLEGEKTVAEGAGAAAVAAILANKIDKSLIDGKNVVTVISGGNIDVNVIAHVIESGLLDSGRRVKLIVRRMPDRPGSLAKFMQTLSEMSANVVGVVHERSSSNYSFSTVSVTLDVRDKEHVEDIMQRLRPDFPDITSSAKVHHLF